MIAACVPFSDIYEPLRQNLITNTGNPSSESTQVMKFYAIYKNGTKYPWSYGIWHGENCIGYETYVLKWQR